MNYIDNIIQRLAVKLPGCPLDLFENYAQLVLTTGVNTTLKNVHDAWSIWQNKSKPNHKSLLPFEELSLEVQELDRKYAEAIIEVANELNKEIK